MAEIFVPLLEKLADVALNELLKHVGLVVGVKDEVKNLSTNLTAIKRQLRDVEMKKMREEDGAVEVWLGELEDVAYEMDDVLDEWITESCKREMEASQNASSSKNKWEKVRSFLLPICCCVKEVSIRHDIALKIRELNGKVDHILTGAKKFGSATNDHADSYKSQENKHPLAISVLNESEVCGRKYDENTLMKVLVPDKKDKDKWGNKIPVIVSIIGVGGIGKTTLAKKVFNSDRVKKHFDHLIWITVSDPFEEKRIASAILERLGNISPNVSEPETLFNNIKESLQEKKFLLVLDDVWTEDFSKWQPFRDTLKDGAPESRILVTTRNERVARMLGSSEMHQLPFLSHLESWSILSRAAFSEGSKALTVREKVQDIGHKIAEKCQGLPLAASFMGNLLKFKYTVQQWKEVLESEIWELKKVSEGIFAHLYLSYNELDPEMKRCFSSCAVFPKGSTIVVKQLTRIWIAQGFLSSSGKAEQLESRARECFDTLAMRSFFQDCERDDENENHITACKMHDIVHDFAKFLTGNESLVVEKDNAQSYEKVRHLSWMLSEDTVKFPASYVGKLRSFYGRYVHPNLFRSLNCVRVLSLPACGLQELPKEVENFIHLRYLDLSRNPFTTFPEEIGELYNLETLDISLCQSLTQLPPGFRKLVNLRHLINYQTTSLDQIPRGLEKFTSLRILSELKVGPEHNRLSCLEKLNKLEGSVEIAFFLQEDASDINYLKPKDAELNKKESIVKLTLRFLKSSFDENAMETLQPPPNLEILRIQGYGGAKLPNWTISLENLRTLDISKGNMQSLPGLGALQFLETLSVSRTDLRFLGLDFLGVSSSSIGVAFPKLRKLSFERLDNWETWEDLREEGAEAISVMPLLEDLNLYKCNRLKMLPHRLLRNASSSLNSVKLGSCIFLLLRYSMRLGDGWREISDNPCVFEDLPQSSLSKYRGWWG